MNDFLAQVEQGLQARGFTFDQSRGIAAGVYAESGGNPGAVNPTSGAFGIGQWLGPRQAGLFAAYGRAPTFAQQLDYLTSELKGGDPGGKAVLSASGQSDILTAYVNKFMRPGAGATGDLARGNKYLSAVNDKANATVAEALKNTLGNVVAAPGQLLGAATEKVASALDLGSWFQRIALAILAILFIGIAISMLAGKPVAAIASKVPPVPV